MRTLFTRKRLSAAIALAALSCLLAGVLTLHREAASAFTSEGAFSAEEQTEDKKFCGDKYLDLYAVPSEAFTYTNNGGGELSRAFDGDFSTQWTSEKQNTRVDQKEEGTFLNEVTVTFRTAVPLGGILYQASDARVAHGYPSQLELLVSENIEGEFTSLGVCTSTPTVRRVVFNFEAVTCRRVKLVFREVNRAHNWVATAKEIVFLAPEDSELDTLADLFSDYAETQVRSDIDLPFLTSMRQKYANAINFDHAIAPILDRAEAFLTGEREKDLTREYGTGIAGANNIPRYGDIRGYCGGTLKFSTYGINYLPTGIAAVAGERLTVYVEADDGDPLPKLVFTQTFGDWRSWLKRYDLVRGKNVFTVPDFIAAAPAAYTVAPEGGLVAGGPVYLEDPYRESEQSAHVKVYIEGGEFYPLYRKGDDPEGFRAEIEEYAQKMADAPRKYPDVAELAADHVLATSLVSSAKSLFVDGDNDPASSCTGWDTYMEALLAYCGVSFTEDGPYYDEIHAHLRHNVRLAQPWAGALAYASGGFCGFCMGSYRDDFSLLRYGTYGWGMAHELGHALDNNMGEKGRTTAEVTNNVWSIYNHVRLEGNTWDRPALSELARILAPDARPATPYYEQYNGRGYTVWWQIESRYQGFWGKLENLYRHHDVEADMTAAGLSAEEQKKLTQEERHVYLCSLAADTDLGYYFDKWNFYFARERAFYAENVSAAYTALMNYAKAQGALTLPQLKFWYGDYQNYNYIADGGSGMYSGSERAAIDDVFASDAGYMLVLPEVAQKAHLGYEISENGKVIGFTDGSAYTDRSVYPAGYTPKYSVRAYDRLLNATQPSETVSPSPVKGEVCRIGQTRYTSLAAALGAAEENAVIELLTEVRTSAVTVTRSVTVESAYPLLRGATGDLVTVKSGATLTLKGTGNFVLDGGNFSQSGALVRVERGGALAAENVVFSGNRSSADGGAVFATGNVTLKNVTLRNNRARNGGGIYVSETPQLSCENVRFEGNTAEELGGAICQRGTLVLQGCTFSENAAKSGGAIANYAGGIVRMYDSRVERNTAEENGGGLHTDGAVDLRASAFVGNAATCGGGAYFGAGNGARRAIIEEGETPVKFKSNTAEKGGAMYINSLAPVTVRAIAVFDNHTPEGGGNAVCLEKGALTFPANATPVPDCEFSGWKLNGEPVETVPALNAGDCLDAEGTAKYYLSYYADGVRGEETLHESGELVQLPAYTGSIVRRRFMGWRVNGVLRAAGETVEMRADLSAEAVFLNEYSVSFTVEGAETESRVVLEGETVRLPDAPEAPKGKYFVGWLVRGGVHSAGGEVRVTSDLTVSAIFAEEEKETPVGLVVGIVIAAAGLAVMATVFYVILRQKKKIGKK